MSEFLEIKGGVPLVGTVRVGGAKNAALPMLMATLLTGEECVLTNVPNLQDVDLTVGLLEHFGAFVSYEGDVIRVRVPELKAFEARYSLVKALRASFWVLGPVLARGGKARVALPGGDAIGTRPVDLHLDGLKQMGADIKFKHGVVFASARNGLNPAKINLRFPSVGATHQLMMAAALVPGETVIKGVAREPEVSALASMLTGMGAIVEGAGTDVITIQGQEELGGTSIELIGDRIEAGTFLLAGAATGGTVQVEGFDPAHLGSFLGVMESMGLNVICEDRAVTVKARDGIMPVEVSTAPFPGFATDLQAPLMAALTLGDGVSVIEENVFESRFAHVSELNRMGASIEVQDRIATITGVKRLSGAPVEAYDIRGGAALVVAGLATDGTTRIHDPEHLRRGYERIEHKLTGLGARIGWKPEELDDAVAIGC